MRTSLALLSKDGSFLLFNAAGTQKADGSQAFSFSFLFLSCVCCSAQQRSSQTNKSQSSAGNQVRVGANRFCSSTQQQEKQYWHKNHCQFPSAFLLHPVIDSLIDLLICWLIDLTFLWIYLHTASLMYSIYVISSLIWWVMFRLWFVFFCKPHPRCFIFCRHPCWFCLVFEPPPPCHQGATLHFMPTP